LLHCGISPIYAEPVTIISYTNSLLWNSAKFIDHVLQPLTQSYEDYIQTSFTKFTATHFLGNTSLATVNVETSFLPIPQSEVLDLLYNELYESYYNLNGSYRLTYTGLMPLVQPVLLQPYRFLRVNFSFVLGNKTTKNMLHVKKK